MKNNIDKDDLISMMLSNENINTFKTLFKNDQHLKDFLCCNNNNYDIKNFRNWNNFDCFFDTSECKYGPDFRGSTIHICEKHTKNAVWKIKVKA